MIDMTTTYLGMELKSPLVASPSPLTEKLDDLRRLEDAGAGAVVLYSLFEEQIERDSLHLDHHLSMHGENYAESISYFPEHEDYMIGPEGYLEYIAQAKKAVGIPIVASLNGATLGGWVHHARLMEQAGADALELNIYRIPSDPETTGAKVEEEYVELVRAVREEVKIPIAVKVGAHFSSTANMAKRLSEAGADALVLFNRFYQPDFDIEHLEVKPSVALSMPRELRLRLRWTALLFGKIPADIAITGGVHSAEDALKAMMAGARVAMMTSALLKFGPRHIATTLDRMHAWMADREYESIRQMQGCLSAQYLKDPSAFERANYLRTLQSYATSWAY